MYSLYLLVSFLFFIVTLGTGNNAFSEQIGENVTLNADFRYRHELIDAEEKDLRNRQRIRARLNLNAKINDDIKLGIQFASGSDDPGTKNQTLSGGFSSKPVNIDLAFIEWDPENAGGLSVLGGKVKNPFHVPAKTELLWDVDLRPEGLAVKYSQSIDTIRLFANASYFWIDEREANDDAVLWGGQAGINYETSAVETILGLGYFDYQNTKKNAPFYNAGDSFGNSVDTNGNYLYDFNEFEIIFELKPHGIIENAAVFVDFVTNIADGVDDNHGYLVGLTYEPGIYSFGYNYRKLEKDAVIGVFTDSDFIGGGTDGKGHKVNFSYKIAPKTKIGATWFFNRIGIDNGKEYHRLQLDVSVIL